MTLWLEKNDIEIYSMHNEGKSVVAKRFIRTLKIKFVSILDFKSKNMYIDKLDDILNKFNNTYHSRIKMKPVDVKPNTYIESSKEINYHDPKFNIGDIVRISNKKILQRAMFQIDQKTLLRLNKLNTLFHGHMLLVILKGRNRWNVSRKRLAENKKKFRAEKVIKRKGHKLYVKWKGYDSSFNSWIDKKDSWIV